VPSCSCYTAGGTIRCGRTIATLTVPGWPRVIELPTFRPAEGWEGVPAGDEPRWLHFRHGAPMTAVTATGTSGTPALPGRHVAAVCVALVRADHGKNHDPAATTPDLTSALRRARSRQDRCAPLRGGLRPVLTQSPRGRVQRARAGTKSGASSRTKSNFWLANTPAIKERRWIQKARLAKRVAIDGRRDADQRN
jgi:hypothetical protein